MSTPANNTEPKRGLIALAIHNLFALFFGITPPEPGKEGLYAGIMLAIVVGIILVGWLVMHVLIRMLLG